MLTDFYELTMGNGYFEEGLHEQIVYFDMFFRSVPDEGGYAIMAGVEQLIQYLENLRFTEADIEFLREKDVFSEGFLAYLAEFEFVCDVWAIPEGTPIFPNEPIVKVRGPLLQAQMIETMVLLAINHQSLIATKANRIVRAAQGKPVIEFGSRRAQGPDGAVLGARAAYIGGVVGTACVMADQLYKVPSSGTMAHSWVQLFKTEYEAFRVYAEKYPDNCILLIDTYHVLKSGVENAIKVFDDVLKPLGKRPVGIRIDSGDVAYLSKKVRARLDEAGYEDCKIFVSNSLDENIISDLAIQGAKIDAYGVGERLITSKSDPVFGGVYKLVAVEADGEVIPKIKISANVEKITTPGAKKIFRFFRKESGKAIADLLALEGETIDTSKPYTLFNPYYTWKRLTVEDYEVRELLVPIFKAGKKVYESPALEEIRSYCLTETAKLWDEVRRLENPHRYFVDLSEDLWQIKHTLLEQYSEGEY